MRTRLWEFQSSGFCGSHCEQNGTACAPLVRPESAFSSWLGPVLEQDTCDWNQCAMKRGNGRCDRECDRLACDFDGLECALTITTPLDALDESSTGSDQSVKDSETNYTEMYSPKLSMPWSNCSAIRRDGIPCHLRFSDDRCDLPCATEACLFDGWDCEASALMPSSPSTTPSSTPSLKSVDQAHVSQLPPSLCFFIKLFPVWRSRFDFIVDHLFYFTDVPIHYLEKRQFNWRDLKSSWIRSKTKSKFNDFFELMFINFISYLNWFVS